MKRRFDNLCANWRLLIGGESLCCLFLGLPVRQWVALFAVCFLSIPLVCSKRKYPVPGIPRGKRHFAVTLLAILLLQIWGTDVFYEWWGNSRYLGRLAVLFGVSEAVLLYAAICAFCCGSTVCLFPYVSQWVCHLQAPAEASLRQEHETASARWNVCDYLLCIVVGFLASLNFSQCPFSELFPNCTDTSVFLYIGRMMVKGRIPYKDLFDHKGIILYWIQYFGTQMDFGGLIGSGVWLIEIANMALFALASLKISSLFTDRRITQYVAVFLTLCVFGKFLYEGGNYTEEYALPWIGFALYYFLKYFYTGTYRRWDVFVLGFSFSVVFFLRPNMIAVWAALLPIVFISFLMQKRWMDIRNCIVSFLCGCAVVCGAVLVYALCTDSLRDMIKYYFIFNFVYSKSEASVWSVLSSAASLLRAAYVAVPMAVIALVRVRWDKEFSLCYLAFFASLGFSAISGRQYAHYAIVLLPVMVPFAVAACEELAGLAGLAREDNPLPIHQWTALGLLVAFGLLCTVVASGAPKYKSDAITRYISEQTQPEQDVLVIGNMCRAYLMADRYTNNRFFYQTPPADISDEIYKEFLAELERTPSDVIVVTPNGNLKIYDRLMHDSEDGKYICEQHNGFTAFLRNR